MNHARKKITLGNLSEFSALMPPVARERVIEELGDLSLECALPYSLSKTFLRDGWVLEHRHLQTAAQLCPLNDLLLFATWGGLKIEMADGSEQHVKRGDQVVLAAGTQVTVYPVSGYGDVNILALSVDLDLSQTLVELADVGAVPPPYYWGYDKRYAQTYAEGGTTWETQEPNEIVVKMVPELITDKARDEILDLGCGEGRDTLWLTAQGYNATGVDVSAAALDRARELAKEHGLSANFIERDVVFLRGLKNQSFAVALNMGCLHMMDSPDHRRQHLARTYELLKPGGTFIINHCKKDWGKGFWSVDDFQTIESAQFGDEITRKIRLPDGSTKQVMMEVLHNMVMAEEGLRKELEQAGFVDIEALEEDKFTFGNAAILVCRRPL